MAASKNNLQHEESALKKKKQPTLNLNMDLQTSQQRAGGANRTGERKEQSAAEELMASDGGLSFWWLECRYCNWGRRGGGGLPASCRSGGVADRGV